MMAHCRRTSSISKHSVGVVTGTPRSQLRHPLLRQNQECVHQTRRLLRVHCLATANLVLPDVLENMRKTLCINGAYNEVIVLDSGLLFFSVHTHVRTCTKERLPVMLAGIKQRALQTSVSGIGRHLGINVRWSVHWNR
jgi:hypothetical protein